ncbi:16S rRNA (uracil(1498)-N(3))-methyltransferase [Desulfoluna butyratoxydans]|uniref:Ribosomal RNA small subunit methyltransferase E n=1 Tax=Desulfoluna butyratoxydans TaxID=231438 RepID=A0A4V6ILD9_9BACT|nr:16S rRNA (uracil(1498)-N(3))-methyltransferase [Desulfoluna butyratoxydans]VFQ44698.1 ribosomal rna small subunit methyltransferase e [Desulfoluna butyratoxydans]
MNLILLFDDDFTHEPGTARLTGRRLRHVREVHRAEVGDTLTVGRLNGSLGAGTVLSLTKDAMELAVALDAPPPPPLPLTLILALPRPKVLNRVIIAATSMGVKRLVLLNAVRVEKSFWQSPRLAEENLLAQRVLGLEQAKDTRLPEILLKKRFKPFVEDELPAMARGTEQLAAHPYDAVPCPVRAKGPVTLAVGPEGGFIPYEMEKLKEAGFQAVSMGERILRVESAIPALLSRLYPL